MSDLIHLLRIVRPVDSVAQRNVFVDPNVVRTRSCLCIFDHMGWRLLVGTVCMYRIDVVRSSGRPGLHEIPSLLPRFALWFSRWDRSMPEMGSYSADSVCIVNTNYMFNALVETQDVSSATFPQFCKETSFSLLFLVPFSLFLSLLLALLSFCSELLVPELLESCSECFPKSLRRTRLVNALDFVSCFI